ncbi:unnamed protein product, partial [Heterosigma akashiwo]
TKQREPGVWQLLWDGNSREEEQPGPRIMHCAFTYDGKMGVYGGMKMNGMMMNDIWLFDPA